jgi:hypothetical protein
VGDRRPRAHRPGRLRARRRPPQGDVHHRLGPQRQSRVGGVRTHPASLHRAGAGLRRRPRAGGGAAGAARPGDRAGGTGARGGRGERRPARLRAHRRRAAILARYGAALAACPDSRIVRTPEPQSA